MAIMLPRQPSWGEALAGGLGTGFGTGLQALANMKLQQMQQERQARLLSPFYKQLNLPESTAYAAPQVQAQLVKEQMAAAKMAPLLEQLQGLASGYPATGTEATAQIGQFPVGETEGLPGITPTVPQRGAAIPSQQLSQADIAALTTAAASGDPRQVAQTMRDIQKSHLKESQFQRQQEFLREKEVTKKEREAEKAQRIEQKEIDTETRPFYEKTMKEARTARDNDMRLARIEELNEKGNLGIPALNTAVKAISKGVFGLGLDLSFLMTADAQELDKLSTDFLKNVKDIFGARITDNEIRQFLKTVPTLTQDKEGRRRIINNMRIFNEGAKLRRDAMSQIIEANNGRRPRNLEDLVEHLVDKQLDEIADQFKSSPILSEPYETWTPKSLSSLPIVGGTLEYAGTIPGRVGKALGIKY